MEGHLPCVQQLSLHGASRQAREWDLGQGLRFVAGPVETIATALAAHQQATSDAQQVLDFLVASREWCTALHHLAASGRGRAALRAAGGDVNARTRSLMATPLLLAARIGSAGTARALIDLGADANIGDASGATPLHYAAGAGDLAVVDALIGGGADPSAGDGSGRTALHLAALEGHVEVVETLLAAPRVDANARDARGSTPLHLAGTSGHLDVVKRLLATPGIDVGKPMKARKRR